MFVNDDLIRLITLARSGDEGAYADLTVMYKPLIESMGKNYAGKCDNALYTEDDFIQEANLGFYSAVRTYEETDKVTFGLYAKICVRNRLVSLLRASSRKPKKPKVESEGEQDVLSGLLDRENTKEIEKRIEGVLSRLEWEVFCLYIQKCSYADIAERLGRTEKTVDNAIYRIKTKLKRLI